RFRRRHHGRAGVRRRNLPGVRQCTSGGRARAHACRSRSTTDDPPRRGAARRTGRATALAEVNTMNFPDYPFQPRQVEIRPGISMSFLDEGPRGGEAAAPEVIVMLHGNPPWSSYWRHLVLGLRDRYRCIVPDHLGVGLADKPH